MAIPIGENSPKIFRIFSNNKGEFYKFKFSLASSQNLIKTTDNVILSVQI